MDLSTFLNSAYTDLTMARKALYVCVEDEIYAEEQLKAVEADHLRIQGTPESQLTSKNQEGREAQLRQITLNERVQLTGARKGKRLAELDFKMAEDKMRLARDTIRLSELEAVEITRMTK
jgi:hypothetical protein